MESIHVETAKETNIDAKPVYVYDEKLGWVDVTLFLENLKKTMNLYKRTMRTDFNLIRLYYSSC
ncbi:hypothetical protein [Pelotomaculum propionicicum]|uniref:Uncharacterized protein n=1 Tax=Pelotomaculum propionicicum TaxID=258475 RepID=A0A4Y7RU49_9FIRM|nr:hypothetical protein [Pelotomaculum propionicicum]NLI14590.1 hypothetical protein [Peptococcaceae bacterium]TEB12403.1 hypothetical protein Pmgp_01020 [Pelotomaculum propionicicum]